MTFIRLLLLAMTLSSCFEGEFVGGPNAANPQNADQPERNDSEVTQDFDTMDGELPICKSSPDTPIKCNKESELFKSAEGGCQDLKTKVVYSCLAQEVGEPAEFTHAEANEYCTNLNEGGFSDWELARFNEIKNNLSEKRAVMHLPYKASGKFWTSTFLEWKLPVSTYLESTNSSGERPEERNQVFCVRNVTRPKNLAPGACLNEDELFKTAEGGCNQLKTGLVFSTWSTNANEEEERKTQAEAVSCCNALVEE
jgi:hypothetical protein